jgi:hypothetical protein
MRVPHDLLKVIRISSAGLNLSFNGSSILQLMDLFPDTQAGGECFVGSRMSNIPRPAAGTFCRDQKHVEEQGRAAQYCLCRTRCRRCCIYGSGGTGSWAECCRSWPPCGGACPADVRDTHLTSSGSLELKLCHVPVCCKNMCPRIPAMNTLEVVQVASSAFNDSLIVGLLAQPLFGDSLYLQSSQQLSPFLLAGELLLSLLRG